MPYVLNHSIQKAVVFTIFISEFDHFLLEIDCEVWYGVDLWKFVVLNCWICFLHSPRSFSRMAFPLGFLLSVVCLRFDFWISCGCWISTTMRGSSSLEFSSLRCDESGVFSEGIRFRWIVLWKLVLMGGLDLPRKVYRIFAWWASVLNRCTWKHQYYQATADPIARLLLASFQR